MAPGNSKQLQADDPAQTNAEDLGRSPARPTATGASGTQSGASQPGEQVESSDVSSVIDPGPDESDEENIHERLDRERHGTSWRPHRPHHTHHEHHNNNHHHNHHHHHHHHKHHQAKGGHVKEHIKPDLTVARAQARASIIRLHRSASKGPPAKESLRETRPAGQGAKREPIKVATVVDEEQLHKRLVEQKSKELRQQRPPEVAIETARKPNRSLARPPALDPLRSRRDKKEQSKKVAPVDAKADLKSSTSATSASTSSSSSSSSANTSKASEEAEATRSPPPATIIIPVNVARSLSMRSARSTGTSMRRSQPGSRTTSAESITREQLEYGPFLQPGEVQVLYRSPDAEMDLDRHLKDEEAKLVAPNLRQSPIAIMSVNPTYELQDKPLIIEYPSTVENLRLNNTGFSWEVKIPYQISMTTALYGAHLSTTHRYRLDQFHCHWGAKDQQGSEHTVDNKSYSAEIHFVHYNMEKYRTMARAARNPDGLVVLSVFLEALEDHHKHAELEKIVSHLKGVSLKGEHAIIKQAVRIENLLPVNKSFWSYQGSLTTPPYFESVTWFVLKYPIKCSVSQIQRFRNLKSSLRNEEGASIKSNHRKTQQLNGRTIVNYDEPCGVSRS